MAPVTSLAHTNRVACRGTAPSRAGTPVRRPWGRQTTSRPGGGDPRHKGVVPRRFRRDLDGPVPARLTRVRLGGAPRKPTSTDLVLEVGLVLEDATSGFCGAVLRWERGLVVLEDRHGKQRTFVLGAGFWYEGSPVVLKAPPRARSVPTRTASGSVVGPAGRAKTALASRIYVEGAPRRRAGGKDLGRLPRDVGWSSSTSAASTTSPALWLTSRPEKGGGSGSSSITWCLGARSRASRTGSGAGLAAVTCWCWVIRTWTFGRR